MKSNLILYPLILVIIFSCKKDGKLREYHASGNLKSETLISQDTLYYTEYYDNGNIKTKGSSIGGNLQGRRTTYYENGNPKEDAGYSNGHLEGEYKFYNVEGVLEESSIAFQNQKYYSKFKFDKVESEIIAPLILPLQEKSSLQIKDSLSFIMSLPFTIDAPYYDKTINVLWKISQDSTIDDMNFDLATSNTSTFDKFHRSDTLTYIPLESGEYYIKKLVFENIVDSAFILSKYNFRIK